jgi:hypothetical protein
MQRTIPFKERLTCTMDEAKAVTGLSRSTLYSVAAKYPKATTYKDGRRLWLVSWLLRHYGQQTGGTLGRFGRRLGGAAAPKPRKPVRAPKRGPSRSRAGRPSRPRP